MKENRPYMFLNRVYVNTFFLPTIVFINMACLRAQQPQLRSIMGIQAEWKGMDLGLLNMNFFSSEGNWFQNNTRLTADFKSNNNFRFGMGYQYEYVELKDRIQHESRPMLFLHFLKRWNNWDLRNLGTMEFRFINGTLRNRFKNEMGFHFTRWNIAQPFILTSTSINLDKIQYVGQKTTIAINFPIDNFNLILFGFHEIFRIINKTWSTRCAVGVIGIYKLTRFD